MEKERPEATISPDQKKEVHKTIKSLVLLITVYITNTLTGCAANTQEFNANSQQEAPETTSLNYNFWEYITMCFSHLNQLEAELSKMNYVTEEQGIALSTFREVLFATMTLQQQILQNKIEYLQSGRQNRRFADNRMQFVPENTSGRINLLELELYQYIESANWQLHNFQGLNPIEKHQLLEKIASLKNACLLLMDRLK